MTAGSLIAQWQERGALESLGGIDCFVVDLHQSAPGVPVVWLHGFPSSSLDWRAVIGELGESHRMLLMDFPGFGMSARPKDYTYSLIEQADRVLAMLARRGIDRVHLIAHDMGASVACELLARRARGELPVSIESLLLTNGSIYIELARLTLSQKILRSPMAALYAKMARWPLFRWQIGRLFKAPVDESELKAMWQLMTRERGLQALTRAIVYIDERYRHYRRWTEPLARFDRPTTIVWGRGDPVAVAAIGERLAATMPTTSAVWLDDCGHFPMLEAPTAFATAVRRHLAGVPGS